MCAKSIAKFILYIVNVVFFLVGALIAILGGIAMTKFDTLLKLLSVIPEVEPVITMLQNTGTITLFRNSAIGLLVVGLFLVIVSFLGCCGAKGEYKVCLLAFCIIIGVLMAIQIAILIWAIVDRNALQENVERELKKTLAFYNGTGMAYYAVAGSPPWVLRVSTSTEAYAWDSLQVGAECCGTSGSGDWAAVNTPDWTNTYIMEDGTTPIPNALVPLSCCKVDDPKKYFEDINTMKVTDAGSCLGTAGPSSTHTTGCVQSVINVMTRFNNIIYIVIACVLALQILEIICAVHVMKNADGVV